MTEAVQIFTATWCKRCVTIKPEVQLICSMNNIACTVINFDEGRVKNDAIKAEITKSLPTIRYRAAGSDKWDTYTAATLDSWKEKMAIK